jgi:predicted acylesterase/phospholipase RssA
VPYDAVVFAGGGNRCLWQAGFYEVVAPKIGLKPKLMSGSSAGATMACLLSAGRTQAALDHFTVATRGNARNAYPLNVLSKTRTVFPHYAMYRKAVLTAIDADGLERIRNGPEIRIQLTRLPGPLGPRLGVALGLMAYTVEKLLGNPVHPRAGHRVGFTSEVRLANDCETPDDLADLLLASSCTPPFTPVLRLGGSTVLDGGVVENVPVAAIGNDARRTLILLTRCYDSLPEVPGLHYVQPSRNIPISKFDYTSPRGLHVAYSQGQEDAVRFLAGLG